MDSLLKTPLFDVYKEYGAKVVDFSGWALPVQFSGIIDEHQNVRNKAGLFDVSHMGEILVFGGKSTDFLNYLVANEVSSMKFGKIRYAHMCNENGGVVDDILVYRMNKDEYLLVVNASNIQKDYEWIKANAPADVDIENISSQTAQLALQGPESLNILAKICEADLESMKYYTFERDTFIAGFKCIVSRTGYTGEDGFEIYCSPRDAAALWKEILDAGKGGVVPAGLGARDTLRFEACLPLYGHELSEEITPLEAGLGKYIKFDKENFIGKDALTVQKENGIKRVLLGVEMVERGIPRSGYSVFSESGKIGFVTTGSYCPTVNKNLALALVQTKGLTGWSNNGLTEGTLLGQEVFIEIREKKLKAKVVATPFYRRRPQN